MQIKQLKNIASLKTGFTSRTKPKETRSGGIRLIQLRDINPSFNGFSNPIMIQQSKIPNSQLLHKNDILFLSKGQNNKAICYNGEYKAAAAISNFIVITADPSQVIPGYLAWYFNQPFAQKQIARGSAGSLIKNVSIKTIENLKIKLPSLEKQNLILKISQLSNIETNIQNQIIQKRNLIIKNTLILSVNSVFNH